MDLQRLLADLHAERDRIDAAINALKGLGTGAKGRGTAKSSSGGGGRRHMSAAARKRISEMMKKRWAERKRKTKGA